MEKNNNHNDYFCPVTRDSNNVFLLNVFSFSFSFTFILYFLNNFIFNNLEDNTIYIPYGNDFINNAINDQVAYGFIDVMKKYNSINPVDLLEKNLCIPHPESLHYANIIFHKLQIERVNIKYNLYKF